MSEVIFNIILSDKGRELAAKAAGFMAQVESFEITNQSEYDNSVKLAAEIKAVFKELEAERLGLTRPMDAAKKEAMELYAPYLESMEKAERLIKDAGMKFIQAERERQRKEQEKAEAEAREKERKEKERLIQLAERQLETGNKKAELLAVELGDLEKKCEEIREAIKSKTAASEPIPDDLTVEYINIQKVIWMKKEQIQTTQEVALEKVEATLDKAEAVSVPAAIIAPTFTQTKGAHTFGKWVAVVEDPEKVPAYDGGICIRTIDQAQLNRMAQQRQGKNPPPGVRYEFREDMAIRAAKR
jgi:hypothetical protein